MRNFRFFKVKPIAVAANHVSWLSSVITHWTIQVNITWLSPIITWLSIKVNGMLLVGGAWQAILDPMTKNQFVPPTHASCIKQTGLIMVLCGGPHDCWAWAFLCFPPVNGARAWSNQNTWSEQTVGWSEIPAGKWTSETCSTSVCDTDKYKTPIQLHLHHHLQHNQAKVVICFCV